MRSPARTLSAAGATTLLLALGTLAGPAACASPHHDGTRHQARAGAPATAPHTVAGSQTLITEPGAGLTGVYNLITSAKSTIDMTMYELVDDTAQQDLAAAAARGVKVRVILDQNLEKAHNQPTFDFLSSHQVNVVWASTSYAATHQKTIVVDGRTAAVMSLNLTSRYYPTSRDFAVVTTDGTDIAAIEKVFNADFTGAAVTPGDGDDLVWSPTDSQRQLLSVINSAKKTLRIENEEMGYATIVDALVAAAKRGVDVQVTMTNTRNTYAKQFGTLTAAGVHVRTYPATAPLYIHAKVILADTGTSTARVFIGSENFSTYSLNKNRELGLITTDPAILSSITGTLGSDYQGATPWK